MAVVGIAGIVSACGGAPAPTVSPADFVSTHGQDAQSVIDAIQKVQAGFGPIANGSASSDPSGFESFGTTVTDAQSTFDRVNAALQDAPRPKGVEANAADMGQASKELSTAMKLLHAYVDGHNPDALNDYLTHWDTGLALWNEGVRPIWQAAAHTPSPTVDNAPPLPRS